MKKLYFLLIAALAGAATAFAIPAKLSPRSRAAAVATPTVLPASDVTTTGFTANWKAVPGASLYQVTVFEPITVTSADRYAVLHEDFNLIPIGSFAEPAYLDDFYIDLVEQDWVKTPDWSVLLPVFARGMLAGVIYSPYMDLTNDEGRFTVALDITGYSGGMVEITSHSGDSEETKEVVLTTTGANHFEVEFENGCHDTFLTITDYGILDDDEGLYADCFDFLDEIAVLQDLSAGDTYLRLVQVAETEEDSGVTSWAFDDMKFRDGATRLAYDVMAMQVVYTDPDDPYEYDVLYSDYSPLEHVALGAGINDATADDASQAVFYDLNGRAVTGTPAPGIYIRRQGDAVTKVFVK